jgi:4-hydroxybenzoate polyprenyltransferase
MRRLGYNVGMAIRTYLHFVKFEHTVFALPFALIGYLVPTGGAVVWADVLLVIGAMVGARTAAMTFNRIADRDLDARNPRTRSRHLVTGKITLPAAWCILGVSAALFVGCAYALNSLALFLSPAALAVILFYPYTKRLTAASHFVLGLALALAPLGGWIAATAKLSGYVIILAAGVLLWVAGFDIIYACQDEEFDRKEGLHSLVASLGMARALRISSGLHAACLVFFVLFGVAVHLGVPYYLGLLLVAGSLVYQHRLVSPKDLSRVNQAFFTMNGIVALVLLAAVIFDLGLSSE